jgi:hypothetical protein
LKQLTCELEGWSLVLVGSFNPGIFHPLWLEKFNLISKEEAEKAELQIVQSEVSAFKVGVVDLFVRPDKFQINTMDPTAMLQVRDMGVGCFKVLDQTPIRQMGINRMMHFKMPSVDSWHAVGHKLAPKQIWEGLDLESPGTLNVEIQGHRQGSPAKYSRVQVQPSQKIESGVYVRTNEHFEVDSPDPQKFVNWLNAEWEPCQKFGRELAENLLMRCLQP